MTTSNSYPWFPDKWLSSPSVRKMTLSERGAYRELLDWQWQEKGYLPESVDAISELVGFDVAKMPSVIARFPVCCGLQKRANPVLLQLWQASERQSSISTEITFQAQSLHDWTLDDCITAADRIGMPFDMVESFYNHFAGVGWVDGAGRRITNLSARMAKWKADQPSREKKGFGRRVTIHELKTQLDVVDLQFARTPTPELRQQKRAIEKQIREYTHEQ